MQLDALLACPNCSAALAPAADGLTCSGCKQTYPIVDQIPWLMAPAAATLWEWRGRLRFLLQQIEADIGQCRARLSKPGGSVSDLTKQRLTALAAAKTSHKQELEALLVPLGIPQAGSVELSQALKAKLPSSQTLTSYYSNLHRDWAWETDENEQAFAALKDVVPKRPLGVTLILGAGAGRLAYDVHRELKPSMTVAVDINPLLLCTARRIMSGDNVYLHEFPIAPTSLANQAVRRTLKAPHGPIENLHCVFGDVMQLPFKPDVFDTVLTPWLIDIVPPEFGRLARTINRLLKPGGTWLNTGSVAFNHADQMLNYSVDEMLAIVPTAGFSQPASKQRRIPYMQSPASSHGRIELVTSFVTTKTSAVSQEPAYQYLPDWLTEPGLPIPRLKTFDAFATMHTILLEAVALVDGKRSLADIAKAFGAKHGLSPADAEQSLRGFFIRHYEDTRTGSQH